MSERDARSTNGKFVTEPILSVQGLEKHFPVTKGLFKRQVGAVKAVDGISFDVLKGRPSVWWASPAVARPRRVA